MYFFVIKYVSQLHIAFVLSCRYTILPSLQRQLPGIRENPNLLARHSPTKELSAFKSPLGFPNRYIHPNNSLSQNYDGDADLPYYEDSHIRPPPPLPPLPPKPNYQPKQVFI